MLDFHFVWQSYASFHSATTVQRLLKNCYAKSQIDYADQKGYENCYPFIYYLEHGQNYYKLSADAPLSIKPVLLFYGMVQLLKACLLTVDPQYPETTSVLAHGVSTRKRKKQSYEFSHDEVKVQKHGLFTHFSEKMFHVKQLEGEKYIMGNLLRGLPELNDLFSITLQNQASLNVYHPTDKTIQIPCQLLDHLHMTENHFISFIEDVIPFKFIESLPDKNKLLFQTAKNINLFHCNPLLYNLYDNALYLPTKREDYHLLPEVMIHYLLLYNLSMISRYETEWWSELLHSYSNNDYPLIQQFLSVTAEKVPYLLLLFLMNKLNS